MTLPVIFRRQARREFYDAGDWYEKERAGLGLEFLDEIGRLLSHIAATPNQFPIILKNVVEPRQTICKSCRLWVW